MYANQTRELDRIAENTMGAEERFALQEKVLDAQRELDELRRSTRAVTIVASGLEAPKSVGFNTNSIPFPEGANAVGLDAVYSYVSLMKDPEAAPLIDIVKKGEIEEEFAELFLQLDLEPERLDAFQALLLERERSTIDAMMALADQGINPMGDWEKVWEVMEDETKRIDQEALDLLGTEKMDQFVNYVASKEEREALAKLQNSLSYTETPLTEGQSKLLMNTLSESQGDDTRVASILTESQYKKWQQLKLQTDVQRQLDSMIHQCE